MFCNWQASTSLLLVLLSSTLIVANRPRGVSLLKAPLYRPEADDKWVCLDNSKILQFTQINDDYCDCADGSDEPGTAACAQAKFHCVNRGHRSEDIPSSRVNDGICDCCDASDEYAAPVGTSCQNTCLELGRAEQEERRNNAELHKRGAGKRADMIGRGKQLRADREARKTELEQRRREQETIKAEKEALKRVAEAAEAEALELYREQHKDEIKQPDTAATDNRDEASESFTRYDANKDGFVEITELQVDIALDKDRNGVVTVEEARYFLDDRDRIDLENYIALAWPRIKSFQMVAEGLFKPPATVPADEAELLQDPEQQHQDNEQQHDAEHELDEEHADDEEEHYDDEEADVGVGSVQEETKPAPNYDPETQRLIDEANDARHAFTEVEQQIRDIENEIKEINEQNAKDYGEHEEYATLEGQCFTYEDREYVYTLCPFDRAGQKQRSGGSETTLGRWEQWLATDQNKYARQRYAHGASCWNGPQRSALVQMKCALEHKITSVSEPNRCEYFFEFETPAACNEANVAPANEEHDEL